MAHLKSSAAGPEPAPAWVELVTGQGAAYPSAIQVIGSRAELRSGNSAGAGFGRARAQLVEVPVRLRQV